MGMLDGYMMPGVPESNYCKSLKNSPLVMQWAKRYKGLVPTGVEGPVRQLKYK